MSVRILAHVVRQSAVTGNGTSIGFFLENREFFPEYQVFV